MLLAYATKGISPIHGLGLFAREKIQAGELVWVARKGFDVFLSERELSRLSPPAQEFIETYSFYDRERRLYIISTDDDRYTNDSACPNTRYDSRSCSTRALRDIKLGEEITVDYYELEGCYPSWRRYPKSMAASFVQRLFGSTSGTPRTNTSTVGSCA